MSNLIQILTVKNTSRTLMLIIALVWVILAPSSEVNMDEQLHYPIKALLPETNRGIWLQNSFLKICK